MFELRGNKFLFRCRRNLYKRVHVDFDGSRRFVDDAMIVGFVSMAAGAAFLIVLWMLSTMLSSDDELFDYSTLVGIGAATFVLFITIGFLCIRYRRELHVRDGQGSLTIQPPLGSVRRIDASDLVLSLCVTSGRGFNVHTYTVVAHDRKRDFIILAESGWRGRSRRQFAEIIRETGLPASRRRVRLYENPIDLVIDRAFRWLEGKG